MHALDALGSPIRRQILLELRSRPLTVGELSNRFPISRPAISKHLRLLTEAGLVEPRGEGTRSLYSVRVQGFASVRDYLDDFWDSALGKLAALAGEEKDKSHPRGHPAARTRAGAQVRPTANQTTRARR